MIKVNQMILCLLRGIHQVSDNAGIKRHINTQSILDTTDRCKRMNTGTDTTDTFSKSPRISGISTFEYNLDTPATWYRC